MVNLTTYSAVVTGSGGGNKIFCERISEEIVKCEDIEYHVGGEKYLTYREFNFWLYLCLYMVAVLCAGECLGGSEGSLYISKTTGRFSQTLCFALFIHGGCACLLQFFFCFFLLV